MLDFSRAIYWPSAEELPDSDDIPVDNELQELIPTLLKSILLMAWSERMDWFFGIDMGIYYHPDKPPIVPDGFLSLGVERFYDEELRPSYVLWDENVIPSLTLEVVSQNYHGTDISRGLGDPTRRVLEYSRKKEQYAELGILYYVIYSSRRRKKPRLEVHKLVDGTYQLQSGNPVWLPEIDLGIGAERGTYGGITREWLYWYDSEGKRLLTPEERTQQAEQRAQILAERLRSLGIDPDTLG
jgi:Uma2 family endonuclease